MDIAGHVGREITFEALGQKWTASRRTRKIWREFFEWARTVLPDPLAAASKQVERLATEEQRLLAKLAVEQTVEATQALAANKQTQETICREAMVQASSYLALDSPAMSSLMRSIDGIVEVFRLLLLKHHPDITEDCVYEIVNALPPNTIGKILETTSGTMTDNQGKNASGPAGQD